MDKSTIEKFSINARIKLRNSVDSSMAKLGFGPGRDVESIQSIGDITVITLPGGIQTKITNDEAKYRERLLEVISKDGYDNVVEQIAYTWFNRLIAIRYMEVNDFLPTHVRVLSSNNPDKMEPDLVSQCLTVNLGLSDSERKMISELRDADRLDELFSKMFIFECRSLNRILPELFTLTKLYENMLLNLSYTSPDSVVRSLVDDIPEDDFRDAVQIIGWMYQYYNSELKDQTFADLKKNVKIPKERIPAATQLFTPDWIVRYMVENSVGRVWLEGHPDQSLRSSWRYYVDEAEQELDVATKLAEIRSPRADMMPSDIKVIDPCMGSGHILVYAFDVLMQIYLSYGYSKSDAAEMILTDNLYGLDIDDRAYQLAYFAVMMKARQYDPDIFSKNLRPNLHSIPESNGIDVSALEGYGKVLSTLEQTTARNDLMYLLTTFKDAKTYGSLLKIRNLDWENIDKFLKGRTITLFSNPEIDLRLHEIVDVATILSKKYSTVVTNPPYLGSSGMDAYLLKFVKEQYPQSKTDLFACFIERCLDYSGIGSYISMITQHSFMFLSSYETLRSYLNEKSMTMSLLHLGPHAFDQIGGEVVQSVSFTLFNAIEKNHIGTYYRLITGSGETEKENLFLSGNNRYNVKQSKFNEIPGSPIAYWHSDSFMKLFSYPPLSEYAIVKEGLKTGDNDRFIRFWYEVDKNKINIFNPTEYKWVHHTKGGSFRKWYGNQLYVVNFENDGQELSSFRGASLTGKSYYYLPNISYSRITSGKTGFRYTEKGSIPNMAGLALYPLNESDFLYILGWLNSGIVKNILLTINPTINFPPGTIAKIPIDLKFPQRLEVESIAKECIDITKQEWDSSELSWNYQCNPIVSLSSKNMLLSEIYEFYIEHCNNLYEKLNRNEIKLEQLFTNHFRLSDEYIINVDDTLEFQTNARDITVDLISYFVGCIFGRYSLESPGIQFAGGKWIQPNTRYLTDQDNIVPINDSEYFGDDIVIRFIDYIRYIFGNENLEENLKFIVTSLNLKGSGTARDKIRKYFLTDFYKDHLKMYSNLPIYWLFDSGKANGFKALIYLHRYTPDLIGKMRQDYLLPMQRRYSEQLKTESDSIARSKLEKKLEEIATYDLAMELYSSNKVSIDLDDGIKVNYAKFQNIDNPGGKGKINLLYKIK